jgi:hypothetical protein
LNEKNKIGNPSLDSGNFRCLVDVENKHPVGNFTRAKPGVAPAKAFSSSASNRPKTD